ncbi:MAG: TonB-dependent receptor [Acidobacteriota bacterium]
MQNRLLILFSLALLAMGMASVTLAQETTTGILEGKVTDEKGNPIANAVITVAGPRGVLTTTTDAKGYYIIPFVKGGKYDVKAEASGYATMVQSDILVSINTRTQVPFALPAGKVETITVTAQAPMVDLKQTSTGATINLAEFVDYVPVPRSYMGLFTLSPGVVSGGGTGAGNYSISGSSGLENSYLIDGVNVTHTGYGGIGAYNIVYGSLGTGVTSEFLEQVQVKTGGFEAEYGQATGGVINTIVKTGGNEFHGNIGYYATPSGLEGSREWVRTASGSVNLRERDNSDLGFSAGGRFIQDKLFWFAAINPIVTTDSFIAPDTVWPEDVSGRPYAAGTHVYPMWDKGLQERERWNYNYAGKLTWYVVPNHRLEFTAFGDPSKGKEGPQRSLSLLYSDYATIGGGQSETKYGGNNFSIKYDAIFYSNFFMEFMIADRSAKFEETDTTGLWRYRDQRGFFDWFFGSTSVPIRTYEGGVGFISNDTDESTQYALKFTNILGIAELKYGVTYDDISYTDQPDYSGPNLNLPLPMDVDGDGSYTDDLTDMIVQSTTGAYVDIRGSWASPYYRITRCRLHPEPPATTTKEWNAFVQSTLALGAHFNLKLGLRATQQEITGAGTYTLPFSQDPVVHTLRPIPKTYEPSSYKFDWAFAPRAGFTWDLFANGKDKIYANMARYYERIPNDLAVRSLSNEVGISRMEFTDKALTTRRSRTIYFQGLEKTRIEDGTKLPYVDEVLVGYAKQLTPDLAVEARAIFRKQGRVLEDVQYTPLESIQNWYYGYSYGYPYDPFGGSLSSPESTTFPAAPFGEYVLANPGKNTPAAAVFDPEREYKALELILNKRFSDNWMLYAFYRYAKLIGNYEGLFRNDNGQSDPNITSLFDFPNSYMMRGQFNPGYLNTDRPHTLNIYTSYKLPIGLSIGVNFNWQSGTPRTPFLAHPNYQNSGEIPGADPIYNYWVLIDADADGTVDDLRLRETDNLYDYFNDPDAYSSWVFLKDYKEVSRGYLGRTPDTATFGLHLAYPFKIGKTDLNVMLDVFNLFNSQAVTGFNDNVEYQAGLTDPDYLVPIEYQSPRTVRLSARWSW